VIVALDALPEGEYAQDEVSEALAQIGEVDAGRAAGVSALELTDDDLLRELGELHRTRHQTLRHASDQALEMHDERMTELEAEYLRRFPEREVDPQRLRAGARDRPAHYLSVEETDQAAWAIDDEAPVPALAETASATDARLPFREPAAAGGPGPRETGTGGGASRGARDAGAQPGRNDPNRPVRTGAEQPWDPVDLAVAEGRDPTPRNIERARQELAQDGPAAIERTVP
jgi:Family of unknown function (DUF6158)